MNANIQTIIDRTKSILFNIFPQNVIYYYTKMINYCVYLLYITQATLINKHIVWKMQYIYLPKYTQILLG